MLFSCNVFQTLFPWLCLTDSLKAPLCGLFCILLFLEIEIIQDIFGLLFTLIVIENIFELLIYFSYSLDYPWSGTLSQNLVHWLFLTDVTKPQNQFVLLSKYLAFFKVYKVEFHGFGFCV